MTRDEKKNEWLEKRRNYITGTDAAALVGMAKYTNLFKVWLDKKGLAEPVEENQAMKMGKMLEPTILQLYQDANPDHKLVYVDGYELITNESFPRLGASLDGWDETEKCPVDSKNIGFVTDEWGDAGSDKIPDHYRVQLHVQMAVTGATHAKLAVLFHGQDFRIYVIDRDEDLLKRINDNAEKFWTENVIGDVQPEVCGDSESTNYIKEKYKKDDGKAIEPTKEILENVVKYVALKNKIGALEEECEMYANRIKAAMGDAAVVTGVCTWKNNKDSVTTDWKAIAEHFKGSEDFDKIVKEHSSTKPGNRPLKITMKN